MALTVGLILPLAVGTPVAAVPDGPASDGALVVTVAPDGSAQLSLRVAYDLNSTAERAAFASLRNDTAAKASIVESFETRMASIAEDITAETGREVAVADPSIAVTTVESRGVVELSTTWTGLVAVEGDRLVVREPFASGFVSDRPVTVVAPAGFRIVEATPTPGYLGERQATWNASSDLTGFAVTLEPAAGTTGSTGGSFGEGSVGPVSLPGFGFVAGLAALLIVTAAAFRRR